MVGSLTIWQLQTWHHKNPRFTSRAEFLTGLPAESLGIERGTNELRNASQCGEVPSKRRNDQAYLVNQFD